MGSESAESGPQPAPYSPASNPLRVLSSPGGGGGQNNPYIHSLVTEMRRRGFDVLSFSRRDLARKPPPDLVHIHWPELLITWDRGWRTTVADMIKVLSLLALARLRGTALVWTGHNLRPHDLPRPRLYVGFWFFFSRMVDHVISLSPSGGDAIRGTHRGLRETPVSTAWHGHYQGDYPTPPARLDARNRLGLSPTQPIMLVLGQVRRYKRIDDLVRAFNASAAATGSLLIVAGSATRDPELASAIRTLAEQSPHQIIVRFEHVSEEDVSLLHAAADVVVLPYAPGSILNSGSAVLSLSLSRPVVVHASAAMRDLQAAVGKAWLHLFEGEARSALAASLAVARAGQPAEPPNLAPLAWGMVGEDTERAYLGALRKRRRV